MKQIMTLSLFVFFPALCFAGGGGGGPSCRGAERDLLYKCMITSVIEFKGGVQGGKSNDGIKSELNKLMTVPNSDSEKTTISFTTCAADEYETTYVNVESAVSSIFSNSTFYQNRPSSQYPKTVRRFAVGSFLSSIREGLDFPLIDSIKFELDEEKHVLTMREHVYTGWSAGPQSQDFDYAKVVCE